MFYDDLTKSELYPNTLVKLMLHNIVKNHI